MGLCKPCVSAWGSCGERRVSVCLLLDLVVTLDSGGIISFGAEGVEWTVVVVVSGSSGLTVRIPLF